jgi:hypothetical protein
VTGTRRKSAPKSGGVVGVERETCGVVEAEGAKVVHAEDVVGVAVGVEDGVDGAKVFADGLDVEVLAGVDEYVFLIVMQENGGTGAAVGGAWAIGVGADLAGATERGDAHAGAAAEEGEGGMHGDAGARDQGRGHGSWRLRANSRSLRDDSQKGKSNGSGLDAEFAESAEFREASFAK